MIGEIIKYRRDLRDWSISELAKEANVSTAYISLLEANKAKNPSIEVIRKIANALEMEPAELIK